MNVKIDVEVRGCLAEGPDKVRVRLEGEGLHVGDLLVPRGHPLTTLPIGEYELTISEKNEEE